MHHAGICCRNTTQINCYINWICRYVVVFLRSRVWGEGCGCFSTEKSRLKFTSLRISHVSPPPISCIAMTEHQTVQPTWQAPALRGRSQRRLPLLDAFITKIVLAPQRRWRNSQVQKPTVRTSVPGPRAEEAC